MKPAEPSDRSDSPDPAADPAEGFLPDDFARFRTERLRRLQAAKRDEFADTPVFFGTSRCGHGEAEASSPPPSASEPEPQRDAERRARLDWLRQGREHELARLRARVGRAAPARDPGLPAAPGESRSGSSRRGHQRRGDPAGPGRERPRTRRLRRGDTRRTRRPDSRRIRSDSRRLGGAGPAA